MFYLNMRDLSARLGRIWLVSLLALALVMPAEAARKRRRSTTQAKSSTEATATAKSKTGGSTPSKKSQPKSVNANEEKNADADNSKSRPARSRGDSRQGVAAWEASVRHAEENSNEQWTVHVEDLVTSRVIYDYHPSLRLAPASNRKLITMALALETLGPDYVFKTQFGLSQAHTPGAAHFHGNVILRGDGDPSLGFPFEGTQPNPRALFKEWARRLRDIGVNYVHGDLVVDASAFGVDQNHYPEHWNANHRNQAYAPIPSAIALCQNLLRVRVRPGSAVGRAGRLEFYPSDEGLSIENETRTVSRGSSISAVFDDNSGDLIVSGRVNDGGGDEVLVPLTRPLNYAGALMQSALEDAGVKLLGSVRLELFHEDARGSETLRELVGEHAAPPLTRLLTIMMRNSNNFLAEQIWRSAGARALGQGDLARMRKFEQAWYRRKGLEWIEPGWDGCGLSRDDKFAASDMVAVARTLYHSAYRNFMLDALPESGRNGTLRNRSFDRGAGRVNAKTGTLNDVSALTGFINDRAGNPRYVFSMIGNGRAESSSRLAGRINVLVEELIRQLDAEAN